MTRKINSEVIEVIIYKIKPEMDESYRSHELETFRRLLKGFDGFMSYETYQCCVETQKYMDLVKWESLEVAIEAKRQIEIRQKSPLYKDYFNSFETFEIPDRFSRLIPSIK